MSFLGILRKKEKTYLEDDAFAMVMELITLAKNGQPYRHLLPQLRDRAQQFPRVAALVQNLAQNLEGGLPKSRR